MAKNGRKNLLFSLLLLTLISCSTSATYTRADVEKIIHTMLKEEFDLDVTVTEAGETLWIYAPLKDLVTDGSFSQGAMEAVRHMFLSLKRVMLSMDKPPRFYVLLVSDITAGLDVFQVGFIPDIVKYELQFISQKEFEERVVFLPFENPAAQGDTTGEHITTFDFDTESFITYLVLQKIRTTYLLDEKIKDKVEVNGIDGEFASGTMRITVDIMIKEYFDYIPYPFETAKDAAIRFIKIYSEQLENLSLIEIEDTFNEKKRTYSLKALLEN